MRKGDRLTPGVSEVAAVPEPAGDALPALVRDPTELLDPSGDAVNDWVELPETDTEPLNVFIAVNVHAEVCVAAGLAEEL